VPAKKKIKKTTPAHQRPQRPKTLPEAVAQPAKLTGFAVGDRVSHPQFGDGTIIAIEDHRLSIAFDTLGNKQIIDSFVKPLKT
jgi:DNA helicase-2/ATP-dependent DNA helicase PcrA